MLTFQQTLGRVQRVSAAPISQKARQGNYWQVGDTSGAAGRSLVIRLQAQDGRKAGGWIDYATGEFGDLIDLLHAKLGSTSLKETITEANVFLGNAPISANPAPMRTLKAVQHPTRREWCLHANSLPLAGLSWAPWPPLICTSAASHALGRPCAITLGSTFAARDDGPDQPRYALPFSQKSRTIRATSRDAPGRISTRTLVALPT